MNATAKKFPWKQICVIVFLGVGVFILWEAYKAWRAGVSDLKSLLLSPFTAARKVWTSITSFFGSFGSAAPGTLSSTGQTPAQLVGVNASTPLGQMLNSEAGQDNLLLNGIPQDNSSSLPIVGIWSQSSP